MASTPDLDRNNYIRYYAMRISALQHELAQIKKQRQDLTALRNRGNLTDKDKDNAKTLAFYTRLRLEEIKEHIGQYRKWRLEMVDQRRVDRGHR